MDKAARGEGPDGPPRSVTDDGRHDGPAAVHSKARRGSSGWYHRWMPPGSGAAPEASPRRVHRSVRGGTPERQGFREVLLETRWFFGIVSVIMLPVATYLRSRILSGGGRFPADRVGLERCANGVVALLCGTPLLIMGVQLFGRHSDPFFYNRADLSDPATVIVWTMQFLVSIFIGVVALSAKSVRILALCWASLGKPIPSQAMVRLFLAILSLGGIGMGIAILSGIVVVAQ